MSDKKKIKLDLKKFNMQWIGDNKIIVMIGPRTRGKSTVLLDYLYYNQDIPFCTCIAPTDMFNGTYGQHIPSRFIFSKYTPELLERFLRRQHELKGKKQAALMGYGNARYKDVGCRGLLIMDDCLADNKNWGNDPSIKWIFMNGRHADITYILTMQYQVGITPDLRVNIDWVFLLRENKKLEQEKLLKYYAGIFPDFNMFKQIFNGCTKNKRCMVIDCLSESERIEDQVFWYKADLHEAFRICYNEFWKDNEEYLKRRMMMFDPTQLQKTGQATTEAASATEEDDYYKYVGGRNKVRYNLNMDEGPSPTNYDEIRHASQQRMGAQPQYVPQQQPQYAPQPQYAQYGAQAQSMYGQRSPDQFSTYGSYAGSSYGGTSAPGGYW